MNAEARLRATEIVLNRQLVEHESAHAAAALQLGLDVHSVSAPFHRFADLKDCDPHDPAGIALIRRPDDGDHDGLRNLAIAVIAGRLAEGKANWPPAWPLTLAPEHGDTADLVALVKQLDLDRAGYGSLVRDALELTASREFELLALAIGHLLERHATLSQHALKDIKSIVLEEAAMQHMTKAATATTTDEGIFEALIATWDLDRDNDIIERGAFAKTISEWREIGRMVPLHWNHGSNPDDIIGEIDPREMEETSDGLRVTGHVDLETERGQGAWRLMKRNAIAFSFGYLTVNSHEDHKGTRRITGLDIFEVSAVPAPANNRTRLLSTKALDDDPDLEQFKQQTRDMMLAVMSADTGDTLRAKSERTARQHAPIQIASFDA